MKTDSRCCRERPHPLGGGSWGDWTVVRCWWGTWMMIRLWVRRELFSPRGTRVNYYYSTCTIERSGENLSNFLGSMGLVRWLVHFVSTPTNIKTVFYWEKRIYVAVLTLSVLAVLFWFGYAFILKTRALGNLIRPPLLVQILKGFAIPETNECNS